MPEIKPEIETFAKIKVIGVGGGGGAAINRMVESKIKGVEFIAINTDVQALYHSKAPTKLHIGKSVTRGLGAGMNPEMGRQAAEETQNEIRELIKGTDMLFITCGCGGGTGSGAAPYIANLAKEMGILTVGVVTKPFSFEGVQRMSIAMKSIEQLEKSLDTLITIPNDKILQIVDKKTSLVEAFSVADDILRQGIQGISELITVPGLINVDFADVKSIMKDTGSALMGVGTASGDNRAIEAAREAIESPLLELSIDGAKGVLFTISGGNDLSMHEVSEAAGIITSSVDSNARIIFGAVVNETMGDEIRITVIATDFESFDESPQKSGIGSNVLSNHQAYTPPQSRPFSVLLGEKQEEDEQEEKQAKSSNFVSSSSFFGKRTKTEPQNENNNVSFFNSRVQQQIKQDKPQQNQSVSQQGNNFSSQNNQQQNVQANVQQGQQGVVNTSGMNAQQQHIQQMNQQQSVQNMQNPQQNQVTQNQDNTDDDEDLEIPAFIRRQMQ